MAAEARGAANWITSHVAGGYRNSHMNNVGSARTNVLSSASGSTEGEGDGSAAGRRTRPAEVTGGPQR
jgi:hypothetical protein